MNVANISTPVIPNQKLEAASSNIFSKARIGLSRFTFLERGLKYFGAGVAYNIISSKIMISFMNSGNDWCPTFPKTFYTYARNVCLAREYLPGLTGIYNKLAFKAPIVETLLFQVGLQEIGLRMAPKAILEQFVPSYSGIINSKIAKITRVALTAAAFSLSHATPSEMRWPNCSTTRLINTFVIGLILGEIEEVTQSPLLSMLLHSGSNIQPAFLLEHTGLLLHCPPA
jgi:membrane protease YdiL (CAAX protease family)